MIINCQMAKVSWNKKTQPCSMLKENISCCLQIWFSIVILYVNGFEVTVFLIDKVKIKQHQSW